MRLGIFRFVSLASLALPLVAEASFGGASCKQDFGCHFMIWGLLLGAGGGIPASMGLMASLNAYFRHPGRSWVKQALSGGAIGLVGFEIAAASASMVAAKSAQANPWVPLIAVILVVAIASVIYARSEPGKK